MLNKSKCLQKCSTIWWEDSPDMTVLNINCSPKSPCIPSYIVGKYDRPENVNTDIYQLIALQIQTQIFVN